MGERRGEANSIVVMANISPSVTACLRSLHRAGADTIVTSEHETVPAFASRYCDEAVVVPSPHGDIREYKDAMVSIAARPDVRTLLPFREEDIYVLAKYQDEFEEHVEYVGPDFETLRTVHDRMRLFEAAEAAGVPVPDTKVLTDVDDWTREWIVKSRYLILTDAYVDSYAPGENDKYQGRVKYPEPGTAPDLDAIRSEMKHVPIAQQRVESAGKEYAFAALYDRGDPVLTYQKRQLRGKTYAGGASVFRESVAIPELEAAGRNLLDHLDWHGLAEVEFLKDEESGEFKLMEVNPRVWGSIGCAIEAGADFPTHYWRLATGDSTPVSSKYETGVGTHSLFGELQYLRSVVRDDYPNADRPSIREAVWDIVSSCYAQPHFDYLRLDDLGPFAQGVLNMVPGGREFRLRNDLRRVTVADPGESSADGDAPRNRGEPVTRAGDPTHQ